MSLPKIIHQTWKTKDIPPNIFRPEWHQSWKLKHPDWEYILWTDEDLREFLNTHYAWFLPVYDSYDHHICRVDAVRYFLLYHYGGVYADLDFQCLKNLEPLLGDAHVILGRMNDDPKDLHAVPNAFMASRPGMTFWLDVIEEMIRRTEMSLIKKYVEQLTGPVLLGEVLSRQVCVSSTEYFSGNHRIKVCEPKYLYPINWREKSLCFGTVDEKTINDIEALVPEAYAVTFWAHSWGKIPKFQLPRVLRAFKRIESPLNPKVWNATLSRQRKFALDQVRSSMGPGPNSQV